MDALNTLMSGGASYELVMRDTDHPLKRETLESQGFTAWVGASGGCM